VGNDGREHQIKKEVKKRGHKADFAVDLEQQSEKKKGRTKKHGASRRIRIKCV
jgi:hypothetical protein